MNWTKHLRIAAGLTLSILPAASQDYTYRLENVLGAEIEGPIAGSAWNMNARFAVLLAPGPDGSTSVLEDWSLLSMVIMRIDRDGVVRPWFLRGVRPFCSTSNRLSSISRFSSFAASPDGNIYAALSFCEQIFRISPDGEVSHFAGGPYGYSPDNIPVKDVRFTELRDIACDREGNVYVLDVSRVRRISKQGMVTLYAGGGAAGGEGIEAAGAGFFNPTAITFNASGHLLISDLRTNLIRRVTPDGKLFTFAQFKTEPFGLWRIRALPSGAVAAISITGKLARIETNGSETFLAQSRVTWPDLNVTPDGDIVFQSASGVISAVDSKGNVRRLAGTGKTPIEAGQPKMARLYNLSGVAVNSQGLWFTDFSSLYTLLTSGELIQQMGGQRWMGTPHFDRTASLFFQAGKAVWWLDSAENGKRKYAAGPIQGERTGYAGDGGPATGALFGTIEGLAVDENRDILIADAPYLIRKVDMRRGTIERLYGVPGGEGALGDGGMAANATFRYVSGIALDRQGSLYVADRDGHRIRKVERTGRITTFAGTGIAGSTGDGGPATSAQISNPTSVAVDPLANVYFTERLGRIRMIDRQGVIRTIAGTGNQFPYSVDGTPALRANLVDPQRVQVTTNGNVYFVDGSYYGGDGLYLRRLIPERTEYPRIQQSGLVHGATGEAGPMAPGMIAVLYGVNLGPRTLAGAMLIGGELSRRIGGTAVWFDETPAPILYSSSNQVAFVVPYAVAGKQKSTVKVETEGAYGADSNLIEVAIEPTRPGLFTADNSGRGPAVAVNQDGSFNSASNPAEVNSIVAFYGSGEGQTSPAGADGRIATGSLPKPIAPLSMTICGQPAETAYFGAVPQASSGLLQVNARVPPSCGGAGGVPVVLSVGSAKSPPVTLFVR